jgi:hypothetical protein
MMEAMNDNRTRARTQRQTPIRRDQLRQAPTATISSIDEALARYEAAGRRRTPRSIPRYCPKGEDPQNLNVVVYG